MDAEFGGFLLFSDIGDIEMYEGTSSPIIHTLTPAAST